MLLKNVRIVTGKPQPSPFPLQDIRLRDGRIAAIGTLSAERGEEVHEWPNAHLSPGWVDVGTHTGDPGFEHREDLLSAAAAAAAGGYTVLAPMPNTAPAVHSKTEVLYVLNKANGLPVRVRPIGAISQGTEGKDLAELYDMHAAGAVAFSDGCHPVQDAGLLLRAMQYASAFGGLIINQAHHKTLSAGGQMHEGLVSTSLGLRGLPALAEEIMVQRDLSLLEYAGAGCRLHLHLVSTAKSAALIREAKRQGLPVTASAAIANLCFTDERLAHFDSNWKLLPPLRSAADVEALTEGVADGTIDLLCSNHRPWDEEAKNLEFPYAEFGMIGLETAFALWRSFAADRLSLTDWVRTSALRPREVLGLPMPDLEPGAPADFTVFDPDAAWVLGQEHLRSRSRNTPLLGQNLRGRVLLTVI
ncbi:MAG TPA: dihydroorotase [Saprospiraceae bacterium]|nr:dihydroorotase [Saprospiraceae bacterium]